LRDEPPVSHTTPHQSYSYACDRFDLVCRRTLPSAHRRQLSVAPISAHFFGNSQQTQTPGSKGLFVGLRFAFSHTGHLHLITVPSVNQLDQASRAQSFSQGRVGYEINGLVGPPSRPQVTQRFCALIFMSFSTPLLDQVPLHFRKAKGSGLASTHSCRLMALYDPAHGRAVHAKMPGDLRQRVLPEQIGPRHRLVSRVIRGIRGQRPGQGTTLAAGDLLDVGPILDQALHLLHEAL
jgi:hypothetical protein